MIAVDTNLLVYAHREDSLWHGAAFQCLEELSAGPGTWTIPWPCIHEFLAIVTHLRIYNPPTTVPSALDQVAAWLEAPSLVLLTESDGYWSRLQALVREGKIIGPLIHDARIVALCLHHGVDELWTADRDFSRFPRLKTRNPLLQ